MTLMTPQPFQNDDEEMLVPHSDLVVEGPQPERPQPMEVVTAHNNGSVENQASDEPQASRFIWTIENFTRVTKKMLYSDVFVVGGHKWRVLIFPKGNNVDYLSAYLDAADSSSLPYGLSRHAQFSLAVVNQMNRKYSIKKDTQHQFNQRESKWGFTSFMGLNELYDPNKGYLVNDTCILEADVAVRKVVDYWAYDSKKETGYVGIKTQGATCYMNSLLQILCHIPYFKKIVHFRALEKPKEDEFCLELATNHTYDDVVERLAQQLGLDDPSKIRLTPHDCYSQQPKPNPINYGSVDHLLDMLVHYNQVSDILYYEVLDILLPELQCLKTLKVAFHHATKDEAVIINIRLPKQATVGNVLDEIKKKAELSHPNAELRLLEVFYHKIYKIFPVQEKIDNINDQYRTLRAEEIPEEEKNLGPNDRLIHVYHFTKENAQNQVQVQNFGEPFFLVIHEGETLADVKVRIQKKCQVTDEEFSKWKVAFSSLGLPEYLEDSTIVSSRFQRRDVYGAWEQYLVLEHPDTNPKSSTINKNSTQLKLVEEKVIDMKPAKSSPFRKSKDVIAINPKYTAVIAYAVKNGLVIFADGRSSFDDGTTECDTVLKVRRITSAGLYLSFSGDSKVCEGVYKKVWKKYKKVEPRSITKAAEYVKKCISKLGPCDVILIGRLKSTLVLATVRGKKDKNTKIKTGLNFVKMGCGKRFMAEKLPDGVIGEEEGMRFGADQVIKAIKINCGVGGFICGLFIDMKHVLRQVFSPGSGLTVEYELIHNRRKHLKDDDDADGWPLCPEHLP